MVFAQFPVPGRNHLAQLSDDAGAGFQFGLMALAVGKADGFHPVVPVECPCEAGCGILSSTEKDKGVFLHGWDGHVNGCILDDVQAVG